MAVDVSDYLLEVAHKGPLCSFARLDMDEAERANLDAALKMTAITSRMISDALAKKGYTINIGTVRRHRAGDCTCGR